MGLVGHVVCLPLRPVRVVLSLAVLLRNQASRELYDPAAIQRQLEAIAESRDAGVLSAEEAAQLEYEAIQRLMWQPGTALDEMPADLEEWGLSGHDEQMGPQTGR